jgi:hypothetical protein
MLDFRAVFHPHQQRAFRRHKFYILNIDPRTQFRNQVGRPVYMVENGRLIEELF